MSKKVHAAARSFLLLSAGGWRKGVREWEVGNGWRATSLGFSGIRPYMGSEWTESYMGSEWTAQSLSPIEKRQHIFSAN